MILVIGEALIDLISDSAKAASYNAVVGGANANVALALARRGTPQKFMGRISGDGFGSQIRERLGDNGVNLDWSIAAPEQTTLAVATIDANAVASYSFYIEGTADWGWTHQELPDFKKLLDSGITTVQYGCLAMAIGPGNLVLEAWLKELAGHNSFTLSHDLNIRPSLGFDVMVEKERVERVNRFSNIIKASDADIEWLYGLEPGANLDEIAFKWTAGNKVVVITRGGDGADVYLGSAKYSLAAPKVKLVDTVGAGDTFMANFLTELGRLGALGQDPAAKLQALSASEIESVLEVAIRAAALVCERQGCEPPTEEELLAAK
jgi:fructokinase